MIKRKAAYALVGGLIVAGLVFNAPSMATYVQNLGTATQTINAATWNVEFGNNLGNHTILPGDTVSNDTITLTNKNNYPVKYTIELTNEGDTEFNNALSLTVTDGTHSYTDKAGKGEVIVPSGETITLNSNVTWNTTENDTIHAGKQVKYNYNIVAEKAGEDEGNTEQPEIENDKIFKITSAYRASKDQKIHVHFQLNESLNLAPFSKDNVRILYLNGNGDVIANLTKDKTWGGFLNNNVNGVNKQFPKGLENNSSYSNDLQPGEYSTTANANDEIKAIKVIIINDGVEYPETWNL